MHDVVSNDLETGMIHQVLNVASLSREEVIKANDFLAPFNQSVAQMAPKESRTASDQYRRHYLLSTCPEKQHSVDGTS